MIVATPGFVLHTTPYSEASVVAKVFTRQLGMRSYLIKGVRGPRARVKQNLLQPLSCVDMVVYDNPKSDLNYIKEISLHQPSGPSSSLPLSPPLTPSQYSIENALRFFMTEVLYKSLRGEEPMPQLFDYVESTNTQLPTLNSQLSPSPSSSAWRITSALPPSTTIAAGSPISTSRRGASYPLQLKPPSLPTSHI